MTISFGLDLAGYSTAGSALAMAERDADGATAVAILDGHEFQQPARGAELLNGKAAREVRCLGSLLAEGKVLVDAPIDLEGLPAPADATFIWQLTKRPVDQAFEALSPLADRIGSCVARIQNLWRLLREEGDPLGISLFETYPAASLRLAGHVFEGYKGHCVYRGGNWTGLATGKQSEHKKNATLATLLAALGWTAPEGFPLSNDEFDAAVCALTGLGDSLQGEALNAEVNQRLGANGHQAPRGYILLKKIPQGVTVRRQPVGDVA